MYVQCMYMYIHVESYLYYTLCGVLVVNVCTSFLVSQERQATKTVAHMLGYVSMEGGCFMNQKESMRRACVHLLCMCT